MNKLNDKVAICYLMRNSKNSFEYLNIFIKSYNLFYPEEAHSLYIIFKGFDESKLKQIKKKLANVNFRSIIVPDLNFDLGSYLISSYKINESYILFLNSYSKIEYKDWLKNLFRTIKKPNVGIAGCSASYGSPKNLIFPRVYFSITEIVMFPIRVINRVLKSLVYLNFKYPPNPHLRTNAFIIKKKIFQNYFLTTGIPIKKTDALKIESGKFSLTNYIFSLGMDVLVVGKNAKVYNKNNWFKSKTFYCCYQKNLMVSDNQTRLFCKLNNPSKLRATYDVWQK